MWHEPHNSMHKGKKTCSKGVNSNVTHVEICVAHLKINGVPLSLEVLNFKNYCRKHKQFTELSFI